MQQMFYPSLMAVALFCMIACWGVHIIAVDPSNLDRLVRRASSVVEATLDEKTNLTCFNTTDPDSVNVNHIYNDLVEEGSLWRGEPSSIKACSNTSPPASSGCLPCTVNQTVYGVCKDIPEKVKLMMETVDEHIIDIDNIKADHTCPTFLEPGFTDFPGPEVPTDRPVEETGGQVPWWGWFVIALGIIGIISVLVHKRRPILEFACRFCRRANPADTKDRSMNGVSVDKPQGLKAVGGTSAPLM